MSIVAQDLSFAYRRLPVLHGIAASAGAGRITAVLGPNATGKSTLLRCAIGALKPAAGRVLLDDRPAHRLGPRALARRVAYVPQRSVVSAAFTVRQIVELGRYALTLDDRRVSEAIERLELATVADRPYPALSVGQQQRVALARALAQLGPDGHLVLDEPASAMDLRHARDCYRVLRETADQGVTVLIAMHDLSAAAGVADDVWLIDEGRLAAAGSVSEVMQVERLKEVFGVDFEWIQRSSGQRVLLAGTQGLAESDTM